MRPAIVAAILARGNHRCAWCACKLNTGRVADQGVVCQIDVSENESSFVASCAACNLEFRSWWPDLVFYSVENARRFLGRHKGAVFSGPFEDYLDLVCKFNSDVPERAKRGYQTPFSTALARIEAQRNAPLDLRRVA